MPPFGNLYDVPTYVDKTLTQEDYIVFEAGTHTDAIKLRYQDYEQIAKPRVEDFSFKVYSTKRPESWPTHRTAFKFCQFKGGLQRFSASWQDAAAAG